MKWSSKEIEILRQYDDLFIPFDPWHAHSTQVAATYQTGGVDCEPDRFYPRPPPSEDEQVQLVDNFFRRHEG